MAKIKFKQYETASKGLAKYWVSYGGTKALLGSPYLHFALLFAALSYSSWLNSLDWSATTTSIIPNLLGFSIGSFAILLAFSNDEFLKLLKEDGKDDSAFASISSSFCHFIIIQVMSLIMSLLAASVTIKYTPCNIDVMEFLGNAFGYLGTALFYYAVLTALTMALALLKIARIYNKV